MNKEKTAMQVLIEAMQKEYKSIEKDSGTPERYVREEIKMRIQQAKYLLKKEQEQIENAFHFGYLDGIGEDVGLDKYKDALGKDYYQSKYKDENVDR